MLHNLSKTPSILNHFVAELRDVNLQSDPLRFRKNLERIGEIIAYEISKTLEIKSVKVTTPFGLSKEKLLKTIPVVATVLRAGLPFHRGILNYLDRAESAFVSAYRKPHSMDEKIEVEIEYLAGPNINGKTLILADPMLATGTSMVLAYEALLNCGNPSDVHIVTAIASSQGVKYIQKKFPKGTNIWCAAIDPELNAKSYIVPGLGDAGDLAFGPKL